MKSGCASTSLENDLFSLSDLTDEEREFVKDNWGSYEYKGYFFNLLKLFNNECFALDGIKKNPHEILFWLPVAFQKYYQMALYTTLVSIPLFEKTINEMYHLFQERKASLSRMEIQLRNDIENNDNATFYIAKSVSLKLNVKVMDILEKAFLNPWRKFFEAADIVTSFGESLAYNFTKGSLEFLPMFHIDKPWLDLPQVAYYFNDAHSDFMLEKLSDLSFANQYADVFSALRQNIQRKLPSDIPELMELKNAMMEYHQFDKSNPAVVYKRIRLLNKVEKLAVHFMHSENTTHFTADQLSVLDEIRASAANKCHYLRKIQNIPRKAFLRAFRLEHQNGKPLVVDKEDWFSDLDPAHRYPNDISRRWAKEAVEGQNLWMWMEGLPHHQLFAFDKDKRYGVSNREKQVKISDGICYNHLCSLPERNGVIGDGIYLYNVSKNGELYILPTPLDFKGVGNWGQRLAKQGVKLSQDFNHNSVLKGKSVICAGCIIFVNGKIVHIDTNSGHFRPKLTHLHHAVSILHDKNVFSENATVCDFNGKYEVSVKEFIGAPRLGRTL